MSNYYEPVTSINQISQADENKIVNKALSSLPEPYLTGLKLNQDIVLGNLTFNKIDANDVVWVCRDLEGWWNLPDPEFPELTRGWGDGSYDSVGRYASRLITLEGSFLTQTPSQVETARATLLAAIDLVYKGARLIVYEGANQEIPKVSFVRLSGRPEIVSVNARGRHDFSIGLKAADPIKYEYINPESNSGYKSNTIASGASVTISNSGNTRTPIIFELTGTITGGQITNQYINELGAPNITSTLGGITKSSNTYTTEIDTYNRSVVRIQNTVATSFRGDINPYVNWLHLYPGENQITFTTTGGTSPSCKINYRSGWIG